jgi:hypothetical protein
LVCHLQSFALGLRSDDQHVRSCSTPCSEHTRKKINSTDHRRFTMILQGGRGGGGSDKHAEWEVQGDKTIIIMYLFSRTWQSLVHQT